MRQQTSISCGLVITILLVVGGCGDKTKHTGGEARCRKVKQGQSYDAVKKIFGRSEDTKRGSSLLHVHTWKFGKARCEVRFSGVAVSQNARWLTRRGSATRRPRPVSLDCDAFAQRQKRCIDALVKQGAEESVKGLRKRIDKLSPAERKKKLEAFERTQKLVGQFMAQALSSPNVLHECKRDYGKARLDEQARREVQNIRTCLKQTDCAEYAKCYWKIIGSKKVGSASRK